MEHKRRPHLLQSMHTSTVSHSAVWIPIVIMSSPRRGGNLADDIEAFIQNMNQGDTAQLLANFNQFDITDPFLTMFYDIRFRTAPLTREQILSLVPIYLWLICKYYFSLCLLSPKLYTLSSPFCPKTYLQWIGETNYKRLSFYLCANFHDMLFMLFILPQFPYFLKTWTSP